jgi:hypothetical protein
LGFNFIKNNSSAGAVQIDKKRNCRFFGKDSINCATVQHPVAEYQYHCARQPFICRKRK